MIEKSKPEPSVAECLRMAACAKNLEHTDEHKSWELYRFIVEQCTSMAKDQGLLEIHHLGTFFECHRKEPKVHTTVVVTMMCLDHLKGAGFDVRKIDVDGGRRAELGYPFSISWRNPTKIYED